MAHAGEDSARVSTLSMEKTEPASEEDIKSFEVTLDDSELPLNIPTWRKWMIHLTICTSATCVTCASSMAAATFPQLTERFHVGIPVAILSVSFFILGLGVGPLLVAGLSEFFGRNVIYRTGFLWFFLLTFPVAFANNIAVHLIFRFFTGFAGSAFLTVSGGSVADLWVREEIPTPMAILVLSPVIGPTIGPLVSGFINQHTNYQWTYYVLLMWAAVQLVALVLIVPETLVRALLVHKAQRLRKETGDPRYYAPSEKNQLSMTMSVYQSVTKPFLIMFSEPIVFLINIWISLILATVYIFFSAFPVIFGGVHHFNQQEVGLSYLGIGIGMVLATASQPLWNRWNRRVAVKYRAKGEDVPPEATLYTGMTGAVLTPLGLYLFAFTVYPQVHWIVPIIVQIPYGAGSILAISSSLTFLVSGYRSHAASAIASNTFLRSVTAAALPLAARPMFHALGNTGAIALMAGALTLLAPVPFLFFRYGSKIRRNSKFAV